MTKWLERLGRLPINIAEGFGRFHYQENLQFCRVSRGSICEIQDDLVIALEKNIDPRRIN